MNIYNNNQYNHAVSKYKLLSSNAGVGSIITTKTGFFIMPISISDWGIIKAVHTQMEKLTDLKDPIQIARAASVNLIDDSRFIDFLRAEEGIINLKLLIDIPSLALTDWNQTKHNTHPLFKKHKEENNAELKSEHFTVPAIHFPRWFYSTKTQKFKPITDWMNLWKSEKCNGGDLKYFTPPRDPHYKTVKKFKDCGKIYDVYNLLVQIPIVLICKNGHIADLPWYNLFCAGIDNKKSELSKDTGFDLFNYHGSPCSDGGKHEILFLENRNSSESWGALKCAKCKKVFSLEGVMNLKIICNGSMPWNGINTRSTSPCIDVTKNSQSIMQMALVTSNSIYYADSFSSLYIPPEYLPSTDLSEIQEQVLNLLNNTWYKKALLENIELDKQTYWNSIDIKDKSDDAGKTITDTDVIIIKKTFLAQTIEEKDPREKYRFDEFQVFSQNKESKKNSTQLDFCDIDLPPKLMNYFKKIQQVNTLALTVTQLGFSRVTIPSPKRIDSVVVREQSQSIYAEPIDKIYALPANQTIGEGIFFEFNKDKINDWLKTIPSEYSNRFNFLSGEQGKFIKEEVEQYGMPAFFLLHTFAHIILKELEFSCGYPSSSIHERLYYSDRMCGVLIYTTDGSEGGMGGLVWQGQPTLINQIIINALKRAETCASDPLCWENENQLNLAACFSCCLVSETSCEKRNIALDRRVLIDEEFGFFKHLIDL